MTREVRDLDKDVARHLAPFEGSFNPSAEPAVACALLVDHLCMRRNKRCLLAYHRVRAEKLEEMCWKGIDVLEQQQPSESDEGPASSQSGGHSSLSPEEEEYFRQYSDLLAVYKGQWTDIDLTGSLEPPKDLFIDVRVLKDAGEIQTEYGYVLLAIQKSSGYCANISVFSAKSDQSYEEQPILRATGRRRTIDRTGISSTVKLRYSLHIVWSLEFLQRYLEILES